MRSRHLPTALAVGCALAAAASTGCTVKGQGKSATPAWKTMVRAHPLLDAPRTLRSGDLEVRLQAVVLEDRYTLLGPSSWMTVLRGVVVNHGPAPMPSAAMDQRFRFHHRSGAVRVGYVFIQGTGGWRRPERAGQRTELPPGAAGEILVQVESGLDGVRDDPVALTFEGQRVELP